MIPRIALIAQVQKALTRNPVVVLIGPRQSGKTTLAQQFLPVDSVNYFDLEDPASLARLDEPMTALNPLQGLVVIDEIQRRPNLFPVLRTLADRRGLDAKFLILGSASGELLRQSSESLAGRMERVLISGFSYAELGQDAEIPLWLRGGFPRSYLATNEEDSTHWRKSFLQTLLERDFPQWGVRIPATALLRFWSILAHYHGQIWKSTESARALGMSESTVRRYLDLLTDAFMVRQIQPYYANIGKRQIKSPKIFLRDSGILHTLLGIGTQRELLMHPKSGASWEGFVIEQILSSEPYDEVYFWGTHQGAEIDLIIKRKNLLFGIECKRSDAPRMTLSIQNAIQDLHLHKVVVIYPGEKSFPINDQVEAVPFHALSKGSTLFAP